MALSRAVRAVWCLLVVLAASTASAQHRKIGEMELRLLGVTATVESIDPVVPKHTPSGVRIVVRAGEVVLTSSELGRFLGPGFAVEGDLSGPGLTQPVSLPPPPDSNLPPLDDPLVLRTPPIPIAGIYRVSNLRIVANGRTVLDVEPSSIPLKVIDQILVTQVTTRALTLDEIRAKGIVLDSDDYLGFEFTMGFMLDSKAIDLKFPVVFDRQGVAVPQPLSPPPAPMREGLQLPTILPMLLEAEGPTGIKEPISITMPSGQVRPVTIPAVLVIPGNIGFLKQFFSAQLYVSNGAPAGSRLDLEEIKATIAMPGGADTIVGTPDDPLGLPDIERDGSVVVQPLTMPVRGVGPDAEAGTDDDVDQLAPAQQAQAEFLLSGEKEGFHPISFDLTARLIGLPIGPVTVKGKAAGGVLVRNASFNVTFTVPSVVRFGEDFTVRATVTNISKAIGNKVSVSFTPGSLSGAILLGSPPDAIPTLKPGSSATLQYKFKSQATGKVVASYLRMDSASGSSGNLRFALGVGERGVPLSPDTLVLPADVSVLPDDVAELAMRVLGQAWSIANAPSGSLPKNVIRSNPQTVVKKALALAEAGLRVSLGQSDSSAVRDLLYDFFAGDPFDPGFDQLLRTTEAGQEFVAAAGAALQNVAMTEGGGPGYEFETARVTASAGPFISFGWDGVAGEVAVVDAAGRTSIRSTNPDSPPPLDGLQVRGALLAPLGSDMLLGLVTEPVAGPYRWEFRALESGQGQLSMTVPRADGSFARGTWSGAIAAGAVVRVFLDQNDDLIVQLDAQGDGLFESTEERSLHTLPADGPRLLAAAIIGPETLDGASPFGYQTALVFDRVVGEASAASVSSYSIDKNSVRSARRQLSGRIVLAALSQPEGPYRPARVSVQDVADTRGVAGPSRTADLVSRLSFVKAGLDPSLKEFGAVVSGRVMKSDGTPLTGRSVVYVQNIDLSCQGGGPSVGLGAVVTDNLGVFELRYVRKDRCGYPFTLHTQDPASGSRRTQTLPVHSEGQQIVADFVMLASGTAQGTVRNLTGNPVEGADVTVRSETDPQIGGVAKTDSQGQYSVSGITVGPITVVAARGNGRGSSSGRIDKANVPAIVDITLDGGVVTVRGRVVQSGGSTGEPQPSAGAHVTFLFGSGAFLQPLAFTTTNSDGRYELTGLPVGSFTIKAAINSKDFATATGVSTANNPVVTRDLVITIPAPTTLGHIEGTVLMPDGSPAGSVIVTSGQGSVLSEANGTFRLPVIPSLQTHIVTATTSNRKRSGTTRVSLQNSGQLVTGASITLSGLGSAQFTVLDPLNQPLANKEVRLLTSPLAPCGVGAKATDATGIVRFTDLPLGPVTAQVVHVGDIVDAGRGTVAVSSEGVTAFGILRVETRASTISGTVVNSAGGGVQGADVTLTSPVFINRPGDGQCAMGSEVTHRVRTGLNGRFAFTGIHPGRIYVTATDSAFLQKTATVVRDVAPGQAFDLTVTLANTTAGKITGIVYEPDGVTPAGSGVEVTMNGPLPDVTVVTDAAGQYTMPEIFPAGRYSLTARDLTTGLVERLSIFITARQDARHDIRLKGQATVRVRVVTALGDPVESAYVTLREIAYPARALESAVSPATEGVATFVGVFEGQISLEVRDPMGRTGASGRASVVIPTGVSDLETTVRVTTTGTVQGRFLRPVGDDTGIAHAVVQLKQNGRILGQLTTSAIEPVGSFEFLYVPSGPFTLFALDPLTGRTGVGTGVIEAEGEVVIVEFRAQAVGTVSGVILGVEAGSETPLVQPGARVELTSGAYTAATIADGQGRYSISGVPEGTVIVSADLGGTSSGGFRRGTASGALLGEDATLTLDVLLRDAGTLSGRLFHARPPATPDALCVDVPDPELPEGCVSAGPASVSLSIGGIGGGVITGSTDEDGRFSFEGVPAGDVRLTFESMTSEDFVITTVPLPPGGTVESMVHLNGLGALEGQGLNSSGQAASGRMNVYGGPSTRPYGFSVDLDAYGRFTRTNVPAGPYTAQLYTTTPGGLGLFGSTSGDLAPNETETFSVQVQDSASITGRVLRSNGTVPAVGASVYLAVGVSPRIALQAQNDGRFAFRAVPLNGFTLDVTDPITGGVARRTGGATTNGEVVDLGDIVLDDTPISVVSVSPSDGATEVPSGQNVQIVFTDALSYYQTIRVMDGTTYVTGSVQLSADKRSVTIVPPGGKWPNPRELTIVVDTAVRDEFQRHPLQTFTSRFHTADVTGPRVVSADPPTGAVNVPNSVAPLVTFDEPLANPEGDIASLVTLRRASNGAVIPASVLREGPSVLRLTPSQPLLSDTTYLLTVEGARDGLGNPQPVAVTNLFSTTDTTPPQLTMSPAPGSATTAPRQRISFTVTDTSGFSASNLAGLTLDGVPILTFVRTTWGLYFDPPADLAEGLHEVTAFAYDNASNPGSLSASFFADRTPPSAVEILAPSSGAIVAGMFAISANAADAVSGVQRVDIYEGATYRTSLFPPLFSGQINSTTPPSMSEGFHTFVARAYDKANLSTVSAPATFIVDNQPLIVTFASPAPATRFRESIAVTATASQAVDSVAFTANGVTILDASSPYTATFDVSGVPDTESFEIHALARSETGETGSSTLIVAVDRTAPRGIFEGSVTARAQNAGPAEVVAAPGAAEGPGQIEIRHLSSGATVVVPAANDGSFTAYIAADTGDVLELLHVDPAGNRGPPVSITVAPPGGGSIVPNEGLVLWISADQGVTTTGGAVTGWADRSDAENPLSQTTSSQQPTLVTGAMNGLPVLRFDGADDGLVLQNRITTARTVFMALKDASSPVDGAERSFIGDTIVLADFRPGQTTWWRTQNPPVGNGATRINGLLLSGFTTPRTKQPAVLSVVTTANASLGAIGRQIMAGAGGGPYLGDIAEVLAYDRALDAGERREVENYLMSRYAIAPGATPSGTVNVTVRRNNVAQPAVSVEIGSDSHAGTTTLTGVTNSSGVTSATLPYGLVTASVVDDGSLISVTGQLLTGTLSLTLNLPARAPRLTGRVVAADGVTPLPGVLVKIGTKQGITDALGVYSISAPPVGPSQQVEFTYQGRLEYAWVTIPFQQDAVQDVTFQIPWTVVSVQENGTGAPIPGAIVVACASAYPERCAPAALTGADGTVRFLGSPTGSYEDGYYYEFRATTPDGATLSATDSLGNPVVVSFGPVGTLRGSVKSPSGGALSGVRVAFGGQLRVTDAAGAFEFRRVGGLSDTLFAESPSRFVETSSVSVEVAIGEEVEADLILNSWQLTISLTEQGVPVSGEALSVHRGLVSETVFTDASGVAAIAVGPGLVQVEGRDPVWAGADVEVTAGTDASVVLSVGSHHAVGPVGGFRVCASRNDCSEYGPPLAAQAMLWGSTGSTLRRTETSAAGTTDEGLARFAMWESPVHYRQKFLAPVSGGFVRSLTTFTNTSAEEVTLFPYADATPGAYTTGEGYILSEGSSYAVVHGRGFEPPQCDDFCALFTRIVLPPGASRSLLLFTTTDPALVTALANLTAADALAGLTDLERSRVINFDLPVEVSIEGAARSESGTPLAGAIAAIGVGGDPMLQGTTDAQGRYAFSFMGVPGLYRVVVVAGGQIYQGVVSVTTGGFYPVGDLSRVDPSVVGSVRLTLENGSGSPFIGAVATARRADLLGFDAPITSPIGTDGTVVMEGLLAGLNRIDTPLGPAHVRIRAGTEILARLAQGSWAATLTGRVVLNGAPVVGAVVVGTQYDAALNTDEVVARATTDLLGRYTLAGLRHYDEVTVRAWDPDFNRHASAGFYVYSDTEPIRAEDIELATDDSIGSLLIRAVDEVTGQPLSGYAANLTLSGWPFSVDLELDAQGEATIAGLPGGNAVFATVVGPAGFGRESALVSSGEVVTLNVPVGQRLPLPLAFAPFYFSGGGLSEVANTCVPFCAQGNVTMDGAYEPFLDAGSASPSSDGRELTVVFRSSPQYGLQTTLRLVRRLYVPADGRFARIVDTIENVGDATASATYSFSARAFANAGVITEVFGAGTIDAGDLALAFQSDGPPAETSGFVVRGVGGQTPTSAVDQDYGWLRDFGFAWENLSLNPGEKVAFMSFVVFARGAQAASVPARLQALLDLSDSAALQGLSAADRALIVNWILP